MQNLYTSSRNYSSISPLRWLVLFLGIAVSGLAGMAIVFLRIDFQNIVLNSLIVTLILLSLTPFIIGSMRGGVDLFEPIYLISIIIGFYFGFRALALIYARDILDVVPLTYYNFDDVLPISLLYVNIGAIALFIGYYSRIPINILQKIPRLDIVWGDRLNVGKLILIWVMGWIGAVFMLSSGALVGSTPDDTLAYSATSYYPIALSQFVNYSLLIGAIYIVKGKASRAFLVFFLLMMIPTALLRSVVFGAKNFFLYPLILMIMAYNYNIKRISLVMITIFGIIILMLSFLMINGYRSNYYGRVGGSAGDVQEFIQNLGNYTKEVTQDSLQDNVIRSLSDMTNRSHGIDSLSVLMKNIPDRVGFRYGFVDYLLIPAYAYVPRAIWSGKPANQAIEFGRDFVSSPFLASQSFVSLGVFHVGDLYFDFGLAGIIIGMFLLGIIYRTIYLYFDLSSRDPVKLFLYAFILIRIINGFEGPVHLVFVLLLKDLLFLVFVAWFLKSRKDKKSQ